MKFIAKIVNGKIEFWDDVLAERRIGQLEGKRIEIDIRKLPTDERQIRSLAQNAYFHGLLLPMFADALNSCGKAYMFNDVRIPWTHETTKEMLIKGFFIGKYNKKRTSDLTTIEFEALMADLRQYASAELEVYIPEPNEDLDELFKQIDYYETQRSRF